MQKHVSSSSEEADTSDELICMPIISDSARVFTPDRQTERRSIIPPPVNMPSTSGYVNPNLEVNLERRDQPEPTGATPEEMGRQMIKECESAKAHIFPPKGKQPNFIERNMGRQRIEGQGQGHNFCVEQDQGQFQFIAQMDEDYLVVGAHVDESTIDKIKASQYIDFGKLLLKDRVMTGNDEKLELVIRNGKTFWASVSEAVVISNFPRWEQAFRIFSNIYTRFFPEKAGDLIQYNHVIHSISLTYSWENVYTYDKEFRMHIARHPDWSWAVILQQAWSMILRERVYKSPDNNFNGGGNITPNHNKSGKSTEYCKRFNKGKCNLRSGCMYEHKCSYCHKFGHGLVVCRKLIFDKEKGSFNKKDQSQGHGHHQGHQHGQQGHKHGNGHQANSNKN